MVRVSHDSTDRESSIWSPSILHSEDGRDSRRANNVLAEENDQNGEQGMKGAIFETLSVSSRLHRTPGMVAAATTMVFMLLMLSSPAWAETFTVDKTGDTNDGRCGSSTFFSLPTDDCTLREAVIAANATPQDDQINLPSGTYTLAIRETGDELDRIEDDPTRGDLDILHTGGQVTIRGAGPDNTTIDAQGIDRLFDIRPIARAEISSLTVTGGRVSGIGSQGDGYGGGIRNYMGTTSLSNIVASGNVSTAGTSTTGQGGGIHNHGGTLGISNSTVRGNTAEGGGTGLGYGGGIGNAYGSLRMTYVAVSNNTGGGVRNGTSGIMRVDRSAVINNDGITGGISNSGQLTIFSSTISGNNGRLGGGISNAYSGEVTLINSTLNNNSSSRGSNFYNGDWAGEATFHTTIVSNPRGGANCYNRWPSAESVLTSHGYNLEYPGRSCGFTATGDVRNQDPLLRPLSNNGGKTKNHALRPASPAIDVARTLCSVRDQRNVPRPQDGNGDGERICDIGAFEAPDATDTARPTMTGLRPAPGSSVRDRTPTVRATVRDDFTNLAKSNIKLYVDGRQRDAFSYDRNTDQFTYTTGRLAYGWHRVKIIARDAAGNRASRTWRFSVVR